MNVLKKRPFHVYEKIRCMYYNKDQHHEGRPFCHRHWHLGTKSVNSREVPWQIAHVLHRNLLIRFGIHKMPELLICRWIQ